MIGIIIALALFVAGVLSTSLERTIVLLIFSVIFYTIAIWYVYKESNKENKNDKEIKDDILSS